MGRQILLRSGWQSENIGDIAHTPGMFALLKDAIPDADVTFWPFYSYLPPEEVALLNRHFPKLKIVVGKLSPEGKPSTPELAQAFESADLFLHNSGPATLGWAEAAAFKRLRGKPFGVYGVSYGLYGIPEKATLSDAAFLYFRDSTSLAKAREDGVRAPIMGFTPDTAFAMNLRDDQKASAYLKACGVRWAVDLGTESYAVMRAAKLNLFNTAPGSNRWSAFRNGADGHNVLQLGSAPPNVDGFVTIRATRGNGVIADLTPLYPTLAKKIERTIKLLPDRSVVIEDGWVPAEHAITGTFQWLTKATVTRTPEGLSLEQDGKALALHFKLPSGATVTIEDAAAPRGPQDSPNPGLSRIVISVPTTLNTTTTLRVHVKLLRNEQ